MLLTVSHTDELSSKKAVLFLKSLSRLWKNQILTLTLLKFAAFLALNIQLVLIAAIASGLALKTLQVMELLSSLFWLALIATVRMIFDYFINLLEASFTEKVTVKIRADILNEIQKGYIPLYREQSPASISISLLNKTEVIAPYFTRYISQTFLCVIAPLSVLIYLATVNWVCALLVLLCSPIIPIFMMIIGKGTEARSNEQWENLSKMGGYFFDRLQGVTTLYLFNQLKRQSEHVRVLSREYANSVLYVLKLAFLSSAVLEFFSAVIIAGCAVFIGLNMVHYIHYGPAAGASLKNGLIVLLLIPEFFIALKILGNFYHDRAQALGAVINLKEYGFFRDSFSEGEIKVSKNIVDTDRSDVTENGITLENNDPRPITFKNVDFTYPGRKKVFESFNLSIKPFEKVKISGPNGSGKTTLIALILGWQNPDSGEVFIGNRNIGSIDENELFKCIAFVNQQTTIFAGTVRSNILMGGALSENDLWTNIIGPLSLISFLSKLPNGLDTPVSEDGKSISGGERQKIGLARAIVRRSPIIILDEPFTHLDPASVSSFISILDKIGSERTIIVTGHGEAYEGFKGYREIKL